MAHKYKALTRTIIYIIPIRKGKRVWQERTGMYEEVAFWTHSQLLILQFTFYTLVSGYWLPIEAF